MSDKVNMCVYPIIPNSSGILNQNYLQTTLVRYLDPHCIIKAKSIFFTNFTKISLRLDPRYHSSAQFKCVNTNDQLHFEFEKFSL